MSILQNTVHPTKHFPSYKTAFHPTKHCPSNKTAVHPTKHCPHYKKCTSRPTFPSIGPSSSALKYLFIYRMLRLFVQPRIYLKNHITINQSTNQLIIKQNIHIFVEPFTYSSKDLSVAPSIYSTNHLSVNRNIFLFVQPSIHSSKRSLDSSKHPPIHRTPIFSSKYLPIHTPALRSTQPSIQWVPGISQG